MSGRKPLHPNDQGKVWQRVQALPPPPALDEDAPANYFNLDPSSSPTVMNMTLPPPPGINPPPPGFGPPMFHPMGPLAPPMPPPL
ncbi:unnamed protein product, partial [Tetraodon nigroviridis]